MDLQNASTLIVGGASGLGEATARALHAAGAAVVVADLNEAVGRALVDTLGAGAHFVRTDITDIGDVASAVAVAAGLSDGLRLSVCCAGITARGAIADEHGPHPADRLREVMDVNLVGTFNVLSHAAAAMRENQPNADGERGVCVNVASITALDGPRGSIAYTASKAAVVGMTLPAARDLADTGVRVCTIAPGTFDTPMTAAVPGYLRTGLSASQMFPRRFGRPEEFAALVCHIATNEMLNGEVIRIDGAVRVPSIQSGT